MKEKGMIAPGPVEKKINYTADDPMNGSDNLPAITKEQTATLPPDPMQHFISAEEHIRKLNSNPNRAIVADGDSEHVVQILAQMNVNAEKADKQILEGYVSEPENPFQAFKNLAPEQQQQVIEVLEKASQTGQDSLNKQAQDILTGKPVLDFIKGIDHAVRAIGTGEWKQNLSRFCDNLRKIATGQPVGEQVPIEKAMTLGGGIVMKGIQNVDQVGQHMHPRAFVHDTHEAAEVMRQDIGKANDYYSEKIQNNDLGSIPDEAMDATKHITEQAEVAINEFPNRDISEQSNVLGMGATAAVFFLMGKRILSSREAANVIGVEESALATASEEQLAARGLTKIPKEKVPITKDGKPLQFTEESGIEMGMVRQGPDKLWEQAPFPRGDDVQVALGENLPAGTKTIDRVTFRDGVVESQKSIDLTAPSYDSPAKLESKLNDYVRKIQDYEGQPKPRQCFQMQRSQIDEKILHFGIPDGALTPQQIKVFEDVGRQVLKDNAALPPDKPPLKIKVTVLK
ncbi:MAG: hypothetical protein K8F91_17315 [Candidatus Obscuribacterales bacterium]|nr:hypothetical protein [Candidatus Obscuribacterales bacterium]